MLGPSEDHWRTADPARSADALTKAMGSKRIALTAAAELATYAVDDGNRAKYRFFIKVVGVLLARGGLWGR